MKSIEVDGVPAKYVAYYLTKWSIPFNPTAMVRTKKKSNRSAHGYFKLTGDVAYDIG